jgi:hypothetical protein
MPLVIIMRNFSYDSSIELSIGMMTQGIKSIIKHQYRVIGMVESRCADGATDLSLRHVLRLAKPSLGCLPKKMGAVYGW